MPDPKKHRLTKIRLGEISLVDIPAEPHSLVHIFKRGKAATEDSVTELERMTEEMAKAGKQIETLTKAVTDTTAEKDKALADLAESQARVIAVSKAKAGEESTEDEILKGATPAVAAEIIRLRKANEASAKALTAIAEQDEIRKMAMVVAKDFANLPVKAEDFAPIMKRAAGTLSAEDFSELNRVLKAADALADEATKIRGFGRDLAPTSAEAALNKKAEEIHAADNSITFAKAYEKALERNPALYAKYLSERQDQPVN